MLYACFACLQLTHRCFHAWVKYVWTSKANGAKAHIISKPFVLGTILCDERTLAVYMHAQHGSGELPPVFHTSGSAVWQRRSRLRTIWLQHPKVLP